MNRLWLCIFACGFCLSAVSRMVKCLPVVETQAGNSTNLLSAFEHLKKEFLASNTPSRITKLFHLKNSTISRDQYKLSKSIFSVLLKEIGWGTIENEVPMYWTEIVSIRSQRLKNNSRKVKCDQIFHPDHFLSNVILENLINTKTISEENFTRSMMDVFCSKSMHKASLHFAQSDDVISGVVILSFQKNKSILALVNVGF